MTTRTLRGLSFFVILSLAACSRESILPVAGPDVSVVNGVTTTDHAYAVALLTAHFSDCTGTAVSRTTLITAGHCVRAGLPWYGSRRGVSMRFARAPIDLAIVVFPADTFTGSHATVTDRAPRHDDAIQIVGYGQTDFVNDNEPDGRRRVGRNTLVGFANRVDGKITHVRTAGNLLHYRSPISLAGIAPGDQAMTGRGDSGGPILIGGKLAGVIAMGASYDVVRRSFTLVDDPAPDATKLYEYDTNLFSAPAIALLKQAVSEIGAVISGLDALYAAFHRR